MKKEETIRKESKIEPLRIVELKKADDVLSFTKSVIDKARRASTSQSSSSGKKIGFVNSFLKSVIHIKSINARV